MRDQDNVIRLHISGISRGEVVLLAAGRGCGARGEVLLVMLVLVGRMGRRRAIRRRVPEAIHHDSETPNVLKSRDACGSSDSYGNPIWEIRKYDSGPHPYGS